MLISAAFEKVLITALKLQKRKKKQLKIIGKDC